MCGNEWCIDHAARPYNSVSVSFTGTMPAKEMSALRLRTRCALLEVSSCGSISRSTQHTRAQRCGPRGRREGTEGPRACGPGGNTALRGGRKPQANFVYICASRAIQMHSCSTRTKEGEVSEPSGHTLHDSACAPLPTPQFGLTHKIFHLWYKAGSDCERTVPSDGRWCVRHRGRALWCGACCRRGVERASRREERAGGRVGRLHAGR